MAAALVLAAAGAGAGTPALLVAAVIPLAYVAYGSVASVPAVEDAVEASRTVEPSTVPPGRPVEVTLTLHNRSDRVLPDVRVVDGVPPSLRVLDGTPRAATTLRPGESVTIAYRVLAKRGSFHFTPARVRLRSLPATAVATADVIPTGEERLACRLDADLPPLDDTASGFAGQLATDHPGDGIEFHSTREYDPGDPNVRIDWRHYAKRDELATINFRERRAADVVLVVDGRDPARVVAGPGHPSGTELSAYAATRSLGELLAAGHDVGVAVMGLAEPGGWLPPGSGRDHRANAMATIRDAIDRDDPAAKSGTETTADPLDPAVVARRIADRAPPGAQVILFSPFLDDDPVEAARVWTARGISTAVISPEVLADNTVSGQLAGVSRHRRLVRTMKVGARTVDWRRGTPLALALTYALTADGGRA